MKIKVALKELEGARATILEMQSLIDIWRKRVDHADIEMSQARISRDIYREKLAMLVTRMKEQGIYISVGSRPTALSAEEKEGSERLSKEGEHG